MIKAIFGFGLQPGKSIRAYRRHFAEWRAPAILANSVAPQGLSLLWAVKPVRLAGASPSPLLPYQGLSMNWFESAEQLARYTETPLFDTLAQHGMSWLAQAHGYLADEVVHWACPIRVADGERSPGFKVVVYVRRRPDLSAAAFEQQYRAHAVLARQCHPGLAGYVQNFVRSPLLADSPAVDAITEMHFLSRRDFQRHLYASPASRERIVADAVRFIDLTCVQGLTVEECVYRSPIT